MISTGIMALLIFGFFQVPALLDAAGGGEDPEPLQVYVEDHSAFEGEAAERLAERDGFVFYEPSDDAEADADAPRSGGVVLSGSPASLDAAFYSIPAVEEGVIEQDIQQVKDQLAAESAGLPEEDLEALTAPISVERVPVEGETQQAEAGSGEYWMVYILVFAIYLIVLTFGSMIATEVATEKSSRVMELIVSSINPVTQMFGKLAGIGAAGVINLSILGGAALAGAWLTGEEAVQFFFDDILNLSLIGFALLFILLGYFLYGGIAAMLGALVSRAEEVNQAIQPLIFLAMIAFFLSIIALNIPDATVFRVLSYVPFFAPQLLFLRIGMGTVPGWEAALIILILVVSAVLINIAAARIYKGGVLMYGKFSFKEGIRQALTLSRKES